MIEQLPASDHLIALRFSGKLTGDDIKQYKAILEDKLSKHNHISACIDFTGVADMDAGALVEGMKADLELFSHLDQFSHYALVSDKEWPQAIISLIKPVFPNIEMRVFSPDQIENVNPAFADIDMRTFPTEREADAWTWLGAEPVGQSAA